MDGQKNAARPHGTFYIEIIVALLFFMICVTALFGVISRAQNLSRKSAELSRAEIAAQDVMEQMLAQPHDITIYYDEDFNVTADACAYAALGKCGETDGLYELTVDIETDSGEIIYTLSSARRVK